MVDAVISVVVENLLKLVRDEAVLLSDHKKGLQDLSNELIAIRAVLQDAEKRQIKDETIRTWLQDLKFVAYEIEDLLEEWDHVRSFSSSLSFLKQPIRKHKFGSKLNAIKEKLKNISDRKDRYQFPPLQVSDVSCVSERQTSSLVDQSSNIIGRDADKEILERKLVSKEELVCEEGHVPAISIVGMAGLGKTTLAQLVFNTMAKKKCFKKLIWVCVSNDFNLKNIMMNIVKNGGGKIDKEDQIELIQQKVIKIIGNKRYLLVLDDVWNEDSMAWEPLQRVLNHGADGSRLIITARNKGVARTIRSAYIHDVGLLPNDECWSIFTKIVFQGSIIDEGFKNLEDVGRKIVEKCGGLPLAVKTIASAVRKKSRGKYPTLEQMENILNSEIWELEPEAGILPALLLSYSELPSHLKNCFCYCSLFGKDFVLEKDLLIRLWVAQGYVLVTGNQTKESYAEEYFDELLDRSLFQEPQEDEYGNMIGCKMHDLVHDLALSVAKDEFSATTGEEVEYRLAIPGNARHCRVLWNSDFLSVGVEDLRTLIYVYKYGGDKYGGVPINVINRLRSVRVLSLEWTRIKDISILKRLVHLRYLNLCNLKIKVLPESIGKLKQLRYLNLSETKIKKLPEAIIYLSHLQTLNLRGCSCLRKLPAGIVEMKNLRHLDVEGCDRLLKLPDGIGRLTLLQTLSMFRVARVEGGGRSNIGELAGLNKIRGFLCIDWLAKVVSSNEACSANLKDKTSLWSVELNWNRRRALEADRHLAFDVLDALQPHPQLHKLSILEYPGESFPNWIGDPTFLRCLRYVKLGNCNNCTQLPSLGELPSLKELWIQAARVKKFPLLGFPQLEELSFNDMDNWEEWEMPIRNEAGGSTSGSPTNMPRLRELSLYYCPKLKQVPPISALQTLYIGGTPMLANCSSLPSLKHLAIDSDAELKELPSTIIGLTHLQSLHIFDCENLMSLPEVLIQMTSLKELRIWWCHKLNEKCREGGSLWPRICHIPHLDIRS